MIVLRTVRSLGRHVGLRILDYSVAHSSQRRAHDHGQSFLELLASFELQGSDTSEVERC